VLASPVNKDVLTVDWSVDPFNVLKPGEVVASAMCHCFESRTNSGEVQIKCCHRVLKGEGNLNTDIVLGQVLVCVVVNDVVLEKGNNNPSAYSVSVQASD
jgi:hypothetical protein